jgi:putative hydrolase
MKDILDIHTHTIASGHAYSTITEMADAAHRHGLSLLGISEHAPTMPGACHSMYFCNFKAIDRSVFPVEMLFGCELNIIDYDGTIDLAEEFLQRIDYAIASLHDLCILPGTCEENTRALIGAMKNPYVSVIGHPDDGIYPVDYEKLAIAAHENHVLLEINNSSLLPNTHRLNTRENDLTMLKYCKKYGASVIMNSDAHFKTAVGKHPYSQEVIAAADFPEELVVNTSVEKLKGFLKKMK